MTNTLTAMAALGLAAMLGMAGSGVATAQDRFEDGNQGYRGGYSTFGGYYDTFGGYGGTNSYGYRRTPGAYSSTTSIFSIPLTAAPVQVKDCGWMQRRARATGARVWKARYEACRRGG